MHLCKYIEKFAYDKELFSIRFFRRPICEYAYFDRGKTDRELLFSEPKLMNAEGFPLKKPFVQVSCYKNDKARTLLYRTVHGHPIRLEETSNNLHNSNADADQLSIILFALESTSLGMVHRHLPSTLSYLTENMNAIEFSSFLKVGENTLPNLVPIFTGLRGRQEESNKMKAELNKDKNGYYDHYPMIWKQFQHKGYVTSYIEDYSHIGTFHYSGNGFKKKPVNFWYFPFWEAMRKAELPKKSSLFCFGNKPMSKIFVDAVQRQIVTFKDKPYFLFSIFSELSHDYTNDLERADNHIHQFILSSHQRGLFNKTVLFFMGDHGPRYSNIRPTVPGYIEERNPALYIWFPKWFYQKYPHIYANLKLNSNRLVSPFDLHETLSDLLYKNFTSEQRQSDSRAQSILYPIPLNRTCPDAGVPSYYCLCDGITVMNITDDIVWKMARILVDAINDMNHARRQLCSMYYLESVNYAIHLPNKLFLNDSSFMALVSINVLPYAKFEGLMSVNLHNDIITPIPSRFERINRFFGRGNCVKSIQDAKFCTCKSLIPKNEILMLKRLKLLL